MSLEMGKVESHTLLVDFKTNSVWKRKLWLRCVRIASLKGWCLAYVN